MPDKVRYFNKFIPDLLTSMKSVFDISGKSITELNQDLLQLDDVEAMQRDWEAVGNDMREAFHCMDSELFSNTDLKK